VGFTGEDFLVVFGERLEKRFVTPLAEEALKSKVVGLSP
jgi:hypothetical protein